MNSPVVGSGHYLKIAGYQPKQGGKKAEVRFALYEQNIKLISNTGKGLVLAKDIDLASRDAMVLKDADFDFVSQVALGKIVLKNEMDHNKDLQQSAIYHLSDKRFDAGESLKILKQIDEKFPKYRQAVGHVRKQIERAGKKNGP